MTALIDGDIVCYRCAASAEQEPVEIALLRVDGLMRTILSSEKDQISFLSGKDNFRYKINPEYKANRRDTPKPIHLQACRDFLISEYNAVVCDGYEADDALGFNQTEDNVIYSIDKDLLMIPGHHFNFVKNEYKEVSELDGLRQFYRQMLIGDTADNIFGVKGIGKVGAGKLIDHLTTEEEMFEAVSKKYDSSERFYQNADCLWIWQIENEKYTDREGKRGMDPSTSTEFYNISTPGRESTLATEIQGSS